MEIESKVSVVIKFKVLNAILFNEIVNYIGYVTDCIGICKIKEIIFSAFQYIGLVLMVITFVLSVELKKDSQMSFKWLLATLASFLAWGLVGVCQ